VADIDCTCNASDAVVKKLRVLALVHDHLVPPEDTTGIDILEAEWKMEYDVIETLREIGHEVRVLGINDNLGGIRPTVGLFKPHIVFNLMEAFAGVTTFDQNVVSYLELLGLPYTGCNPRGLILARDKALSKKLLAYHRIRVPDFTVVRPGRRVALPKRLTFPLIVKSLFFEASTGISQASVVENHDQLARRVTFIHEKLGTAAIVEQFIDGRELYVGVIGNERLDVLPPWEMSFAQMPDNRWKIATERVKWSTQYQKRHGIMTDQAKLDASTAERMQRIAKRAYRALDLSGYARVDVRMEEEGRMYVLEANPNPNMAYGEDFSESAEAQGISYERLLDRLIALGLRWQPARTG
jgi:D-alanine-D-alanine ligase